MRAVVHGDRFAGLACPSRGCSCTPRGTGRTGAGCRTCPGCAIFRLKPRRPMSMTLKFVCFGSLCPERVRLGPGQRLDQAVAHDPGLGRVRVVAVEAVQAVLDRWPGRPRSTSATTPRPAPDRPCRPTSRMWSWVLHCRQTGLAAAALWGMKALCSLDSGCVSSGRPRPSAVFEEVVPAVLRLEAAAERPVHDEVVDAASRCGCGSGCAPW